jgi:transcriptional regulator with XRE-family HTH domain
MKLSNQWQAILLMSFSKRLAAIRKERGLTQQQMSEVIGIHLSQVKRYESGDTQPSLEVLRKIALALNVSADVLLFDEDERGPADDFRMQFEALNQFSPNEKAVAKELLDSLILKHTANRLSTPTK